MITRYVRLALVLAAMIFPGGAAAGTDGWTVTQVTHGPGQPALFPQLSNPHIVWTEAVGKISQVFLYDMATGTTKQITNEPIGAYGPNISGNYVTYASFTGLMLYDIAKDTHSVIKAYTRDPKARPPWFPQGALGGHIVVFDDGVGGLSYYDIEKGTTTPVVSDNKIEISSCVTDGETIVWRQTSRAPLQAGAQPGGSLRAYDIQSGKTTNVSGQGEWDDDWPTVKEGVVAWTRRDRAQTMVEGIFIYDLNAQVARQVAGPKVSRPGGFSSDGHGVIWFSNSLGGVPTRKALRMPEVPTLVYEYDVKAGKNTQIGTVPVVNGMPQVAGDLFCWGSAAKDGNWVNVYDGKATVKVSAGEPCGMDDGAVLILAPETGPDGKIIAPEALQIFLATRTKAAPAGNAVPAK